MSHDYDWDVQAQVDSELVAAQCERDAAKHRVAELEAFVRSFLEDAPMAIDLTLARYVCRWCEARVAEGVLAHHDRCVWLRAKKLLP